MSHPHAVKNPERYKQRTLRAFRKVSVAMEDVEFECYVAELKMYRIMSRVILSELTDQINRDQSILKMFKSTSETGTYVSSRELRSPYNQ